MPTSTLHLKKGTAKPLHSGHPWVFKDAVARIDGQAQAGDEIRIVDERGTVIGRGFYSPDSAIVTRLITRADVPITEETLAARIDEALSLRRDVLGLGAMAARPAASGSSDSPSGQLPQSHLLNSIDEQLAKIKTFAAQYGMDAAEETAELRKRREELIKTAAGDTSVGSSAATARRAHTTAYRLINSEGDGLGGLIVDVYGDYLAIQSGTVGIDRRLEAILDLLEERLHPKAILDRSDSRTRKFEKLPPPKIGPLRGSEPEAPFVVLENGLEMFCDLRSGQGQKTGLYLDQRENRACFAGFAAGRNVLDVFSYSGAFSLLAIKSGARSITLVESSEEALELARRNLEHNRIDDADLVNAGWSEGFKHLREAGRQFNLIVLDPPKFARSREDISSALSGYRDLNAQAVRLLSPGGLLMTCSCSGNVSEQDFERAVASGIRSSGRRAALLERRAAGPDHPIPPGFDQGKYLKCLLLQVV